MGRPPVDPAVRFWRFVEKTETCWLWQGKTNGGYGYLNRPGGGIYAHRFAYEEQHGPIPEGLTLDHLCRVRRCVRPDHLEAVSLTVNILRGTGWAARNARKEFCRHGHRFDENNTYTNPAGERVCRICQGEARRRYEQRARARRSNAA